MESNEKAELIGKIGTDSERESKMTAKGWGRLEAGGIEQKGKKDSWTWTTGW